MPRPPTAHPSRSLRARTPTRSSHVLSIRLKASPSGGAPWAFAAPTGPPLVLREPQFRKFRPGRPASPTNGLAFYFLASEHHLSLQSLCRDRTAIETAMLS